MTSRSLCLFAAAALLTSPLLAGSALFAQQPSDAPAQSPTPPAHRREIPPPKNLKVLPKNTTGPQVIAIMRKFTGDLGVECNYCHAESSETKRLDFASDANPMKDRARVMIRMANAINAEYLTQLKDPPTEEHVTCGTCHRGMSTPPEFVPPPEEHHEAPHPPASGEAPPSH